MRKKQLFALLMAGALSVGMAPTATFAAEDAALEEVSGELDGSSGADETPAEDSADTPAEDTTGEDQTADPTETPEEDTSADTTGEDTTDSGEAEAQAAEADGAAIVIGTQTYPSLAEAFAAVPDSTDMTTGEPTYIKVQGEIEVDATIDVPANKNIMLVAAAEGTTIKRAAGFNGSMFTVNGGNLQMAGGAVTDSDGTVIGNGTLTVDGAGDGVEGSIVEVISGNYALTDGATLTGNKTTGNGGAISSTADAKVYLLGGAITGNSASSGGAIYSEGTVNLSGTVSVTGNTVTNSDPEAVSNVVLSKDGVLNVIGTVIDSTIGVAVQEAVAGRTVLQLGDGVTDVKLADVLSQVTYEGDSSLKLGEDGTLISTAEPTPVPTSKPSVDVSVKEISTKWLGHNTVQIKFQSNVDGTYYYEVVKHGAKKPTIDSSKAVSSTYADTNTTVKIDDLPEYDVDIYVYVVSKADKNRTGDEKFTPIGAERPAAPTTVTPTPTPHNAVVPNVNESVVQGFENALVFYPNTFYDFKVIGAGTQNSNPGEGDVRWVPVGWSMSSNPTTWNTSWKIGAKNGIYTDTEKAYTIYIKYNKQVYSGNNWEDTDASEILSYQFKAAPLTAATVTPSSDGTSGSGSTDGTAESTTDVTPTTYADGTNGTSKSAVSTGDESPIGTMMALAAASVLAGGCVLVRRRKKEQ